MNRICSIPDCGGVHYGRSWCEKHYARWRIYGDPTAPDRRAIKRPPAPGKPCSQPGCDKVGKVTRGLCPTHYMRVVRHGRADAVRGWEKKGLLHSGHQLYPTWQQMVLRCHDPKNSRYYGYGALGISVCQRWRDDFQNFLADMGERPEGMTVDRIDPTGDYEPSNCRWADAKTQRNNLSAAGDKRTREAISKAKKAYWQRWRAERGLPEAAPTRAEYRARNKAPDYLKSVSDAVQRRPN